MFGGSLGEGLVLSESCGIKGDLELICLSCGVNELGGKRGRGVKRGVMLGLGVILGDDVAL